MRLELLISAFGLAFGESIPAELLLMVSKKMNAMEEAKAIIARVATPCL